MSAELSPAEIQRYLRHLALPQVGLEGQKKLKSASVLIIGTGGLGSPVSMYLAAAGVGCIGLVDYDVVDFSNLQRQIVHATSSIGVLKVESARERLQDINPNIEVRVYNEPFTSANAKRIVIDHSSQGYDIVVDCSDNFPTRYLSNDVCVMLGKPNVYGAILRFDGQASVFDAKRGPCYRCLFPEPPPPGSVPTCAESGVLGIIPGVIGAIQATETVKLILGIGESLIGRFLLYDALDMSFETIKLQKNPVCKICGPNPEITELIDYDAFCGVPGHEQGEEAPNPAWTITAGELAERLQRGDPVLLLDVRDPYELQISHMDGAKLIPLNQLAARHLEMDKHQEIVVICRSGGRSAQALDLLLGAGFEHVKILQGGINAWAQAVNPAMIVY